MKKCKLLNLRKIEETSGLLGGFLYFRNSEQPSWERRAKG